MGGEDGKRVRGSHESRRKSRHLTLTRTRFRGKWCRITDKGAGCFFFKKLDGDEKSKKHHC